MKKALLIVVLGCTALVLLAAVGIGLLLATVNPNDYKPYFSQAVYKATGRQLVFAGDIELAIFPELGLKTGGLTLRDAEGFGAEPFASVEGALVRIALEPLLDNKLVVEEVSLAAPRLKLAIDSGGAKNWETGFGKKTPTAGVPSALQAAPDNLDPTPLEDSRAAPEQTEKPSEKTHFSLQIKEITCFGTKIVYRDLSAGSGFSASLNDFSLSGLALDQDMALDLSGKIADENSALKSDFSLTAAVRAGSDGSFAALISKLTAQAQGLLPAPLNLELQSHLHYAPGEGRISIRQTGGRLSLSQAETGGKAFAAAFQGEADVIPGGKQPLSVTANLRLDALDLDALTSALDPAQGTGGDSQISGAPNMPKPKVITAQQADAEHKTKNASGLKLDGLEANLALNIDSLTIKGQSLQQIETSMSLKNGKANLPFQATLHGGRLSGAAALDATKTVPTLTLNAELANMNLEQATRAFTGKYTITGVCSAKATLQATGADSQALLASLKGTAQAQALNGEVRGFKLIPGNLPNITPVPEHFPYERISASAAIAAGTATSRDILLVSSVMGGQGGGLVRLLQGQMDLGIDFMLANLPPAVPVSINGPFANLAYSVDMHTFMRNVAESALYAPESAVELLRKPQSAVELLKDSDAAKGALRQIGGQLFRP